MQRLFRAIIMVFMLIIGCQSAFATDFSDLWWNPAESGWGVTITQQADTMFLTFFVYGPDNKPTWLTATATYQAQNAQGALFYVGDLYATTGPFYGGPFSPSGVGIRKVGTATFRADTVTTGALTYTVDGVVVNKAIERESLKLMNFTGDYLGAVVEDDFNCANPLLNAHSADLATLTVQHNGTQFNMTGVSITGTTCVYQGTYGQSGRMGSIDGSYSCSSGVSGTFTAFEIEQSTAGMTARYVGHASGCQISGTFGGLFR